MPSSSLCPPQSNLNSQGCAHFLQSFFSALQLLPGFPSAPDVVNPPTCLCWYCYHHVTAEVHGAEPTAWSHRHSADLSDLQTRTPNLHQGGSGRGRGVGGRSFYPSLQVIVILSEANVCFAAGGSVGVGWHTLFYILPCAGLSIW